MTTSDATSLVDKTLDEKLGYAKFENLLLRKIEEATLSPCQVKKMTEDMLDNQGVSAPVPKTVKREAKKAFNIRLERKDRL